MDEHDYQTKKNQAVRFLTEGDKVKASLRFRGRQMAHRELGYNIINRLIQDIGDAGMVEFMPRMEGTILHAILAPPKKEGAKPKPAAAGAATGAAPSAQHGAIANEDDSQAQAALIGRPLRFDFNRIHVYASAWLFPHLHAGSGSCSLYSVLLSLCRGHASARSRPRPRTSPPPKICAI